MVKRQRLSQRLKQKQGGQKKQSQTTQRRTQALMPLAFTVLIIAFLVSTTEYSTFFKTLQDGSKVEILAKFADLSPADIRSGLLEAGDTPLFDPDKHQASDENNELFQRLDKIRYVCGDLCTINSKKEIEKRSRIDPTTNAPTLQVTMPQCPSILALEEIDASSMRCKNFTSAESSILEYYPPELQPYYTLQQSILLRNFKPRCDIYMTTNAGDSRLWATGNVWKQADIEVAMHEIANGTHFGSYGTESVSYVRDILKQAPIEGKTILVIGSSAPWLEATLLYLGAAKVTTLEYGALVSQHPQIETMTPDVFRKRYQDGTLGLFDAVVHHSSLEHSGLGRYGDALNPWGDLLAMARAWCVTKPGGWLYAGLPSACHADEVMSNWHRIYGRLRWPLITSGWTPLSKNYAASFDLSRVKGCIWGDKMGGEGYLFRKREE